MAWWDFYKLWTYQFEKGPLEKKEINSQVTGAGVVVPDAMPDLRGELWSGGTRGQIRLHDSNDFIDLSTVTNRQSRYKEYERLRNVAEIEMAMTVMADEACVSGETRIATLFEGFKSMKYLVARWKKDPSPFLVYCWDFDKNDYTLGWAYDPRFVKKSKTVKVMLDDGNYFITTDDHRILNKNQEWIHAGDLKIGDELTPFYKLDPNKMLNEINTNQYPRIWTNSKGWVHERQFIDEWKNGPDSKFEKVNKILRLLSEGAGIRQVEKMMGHHWPTLKLLINKQGFTLKEIKNLGNNKKQRRVTGVFSYGEMNVYDLSVKDHENFCTDSVVMHNCQKDDKGNVFSIRCKNEEIQKELEFLCFNKNMLNLNRKIWQMTKRLCIFGDGFYELVTDPENPKEGVLKIQELPPDSMYKIVTTKGKLVEYQQSKEGPDYQALTRSNVTKSTDIELQQSTAIRFSPYQVVHMNLGDDRKTFYPYGQSLIEPARGPAHQLRLMEDAMMVYRLCLVGNTRVRTDHGYKHIKDLKIGDVVYSYGENEKTIKTKVVNFMNNGTKEVYRVRSKHVEIIGTETHPLLINRQGVIQYVDIKDLVVGKDKIINVEKEEENKKIKMPNIIEEKWAKLDSSQRTAFRNSIYKNKSKLIRKCGNFSRVKQFLYSEGKALPFEQAVEICDVFSLEPNKLIITNKGQINSERLNIPEYINEEFAKLFGFLIGDGSIRKNGYQLSFAAGINHEQNEFYCKILEKYFGKVRFERDKRRKNKKLGNYVVDSSMACKLFLQMGFVLGTKNKRIPNWVYNAPKSIRKAFVEGISNADGCERYTKKGTWFSTIELCNEKLIEDIKEIWSSIGLCSGKLKYRKRKGGHLIDKNRKMPSTECWSITISNKKMSKYENIISVDYFGKEEVFDITVDNEIHNFIANGIPTHNTRAPERRVFYIDVGQLPPYKAEAFIDRMKDQFKKKKTSTNQQGANSIEERWYAPASDEDYWIPIRPSANTRIETLPGAQNLGEIDDALYFRNKLFAALNFPKNYINVEDPGSTRITLSAQDARFARMIERIQSSIEDGITEVCERHLEMRGFPFEEFQDLKIEMTPPSAWKELSEAEILNNRINVVTTLKGSLVMSDYDLLTKFMRYSDEETEKILSRNKIQKLEELKLQIVGQNPQLLGVGMPGQESDQTEIGTQPGGPNPLIGIENQDQETPESSQENLENQPEEQSEEQPKLSSSIDLQEPSEEDIKKYNLEIEDYDTTVDDESIDWSQEE